MLSFSANSFMLILAVLAWREAFPSLRCALDAVLSYRDRHDSSDLSSAELGIYNLVCRYAVSCGTYLITVSKAQAILCVRLSVP